MLGLRASFLAKTAPGEEGSSGHVHLSCWSDGANAFAPEEPTASCRRRSPPRSPGSWSTWPAPRCSSTRRSTPTSASCPAGSRRSTRAGASRTARPLCARSARRRPERCRIECRRPGADANPYLALAALRRLGRRRDPRRRGAAPARRGRRLRTRSTSPRCRARSRAPSPPSSRRRAARGRSARPSPTTTRSRAAWELRAWRESVSDWERERYERAV